MEIGTILLYFSILFGIISIFSLIFAELKDSGKKTAFEQLIPHSKKPIRATAILISAAMALLLYYLIISDFSVHYVWQYTSKDLPFIYKISALWTGEAGSIMFLAWTIILMAFIVSESHGQETKFFRRIQIIILLIGIMFIFITAFLSPFISVFDTGSVEIPEDGAGLNPLLINKWMIFHPPGIFLPYGIMVVIFASAILHLLDRKGEWEEFSRPYGRAAWIILGAGMVTGVMWSYEVWESYWIWDPAFISILMTWLLLTAYLHSTSLYRRNRAKWLTPTLAVNGFISAMYSTYIIRSGTLNSAHSFSEGSDIFSLLLLVILLAIVSEGLVTYRYFLLEKDEENGKSTLLSNKNIFYVTIILLMGLAFILFWGLTATLILKNFGASISVGLYGTWSYPLTIAFIAVLGICMLEILGKWWKNGIIFGGVLILAIVLIKPAENIYTDFSGAVLVFAGIGTMYRIIKSLNISGIRKKLFSCAPHISHLGVVLLLIGILMSTYASSDTLLFMKFNEKKSIGGYEIELTNLAFPIEHEHVSATMTKIGNYNIYKDGFLIDSGEARFREIKGELITEPFIYRGLLADVNIRYQGIGTQTPLFLSVANVRVIPGMSILWAGCILVVIGLIPLLFFRKE
ncbi:MAG: hypothetical protein FIB07_02865 [Candidatus Methanoperedens sp.]|nr:hypothetical protein [Candidatus Methanoperedens sp.]